MGEFKYHANNLWVTPNQGNIHFMHINKTAGTSVTGWLSKLGIKPAGLKPGNKSNSCHEMVHEHKSNMFYFTIVRNPYDRLASHYFHWSQQGRQRKENWWTDNVTDLDKYISMLGEKRKSSDMIIGDQMKRHQVEFIKPCHYWIRNSHPDVKFKVFKTEELSELVNFFEFFFKENYKLGHGTKLEVNKSTATKKLQSYKELYNKESIEIIQSLFKDDFKEFEYRK